MEIRDKIKALQIDENVDDEASGDEEITDSDNEK